LKRQLEYTPVIPTAKAEITDDALESRRRLVSSDTTYPTNDANAMPGHWSSRALRRTFDANVYPENLHR
jgi:hypothetical protein